MGLLRLCHVGLRHPVCLYLVSVISVGLLVLVFQPFPRNSQHLRLWQQSPSVFQPASIQPPPPAPSSSYGQQNSLSASEQRGVSSVAAGDEGNQSSSSSESGGTDLPPSLAECVGSDESLGEVEDLLCLPKPNYDPNMKNPCWWQPQHSTVLPATSSAWPPVPSPGLSQSANTSVNSLSCLPYFHILCCSKSGTTDMYRRISIHPDIVPNFGIFGKERLWWSWGKYGYKSFWERKEPDSFEKYVKGFGILARDLQKAAKENPKDLKRLVTLDGSPPDMWDLRGWNQLPQNRNLRQPAVLTPHLMRHLYRDPKFLILVREPIERLYTSYLFHGLGRSAKEFHDDTLSAIAQFDRCLDTAPDRIECFVNGSFIDYMPVFLHFSCYSVYFKEWLKVYPKEQFLFLRTEDYAEELKDTLLQIFKFLDLPRPSVKDLQKMLTAPVSYHTRQKDLAGPMLNETRDLLQRWYRPWNQELAELLGDTKWLWEDLELDN